MVFNDDDNNFVIREFKDGIWYNIYSNSIGWDNEIEDSMFQIYKKYYSKIETDQEKIKKILIELI
jgi:hypothetical protein